MVLFEFQLISQKTRYIVLSLWFKMRHSFQKDAFDKLISN